MERDVSGLLAGIELGGTKCVCVLASGPDDIRDEQRITTTDPQTTLGAIEQALDSWREKGGFAALGIGSFGPLALNPEAPDFGFITATPKPGWQHTDVAARLSRRYGVPMRIDTDVAGAALAEGRWGDAQGLETFIYITVGTGIGAGIIVNGRPVLGIGHPEAGHVKVPRFPGDDWAGACIFHGDCVEGLASGFAIEKRTGQRGGTIASSDPIWENIAHALTGLCHHLTMIVSPQRILIGGGVVTKQPQLLPMIRTMLIDRLAGYGDAPIIAAQIERYIAPPALGDQAGPLGSIALAGDALRMSLG